MRKINSLNELNIPLKHKNFIQRYLQNISHFDCIDRVILFGSCARGQATENSDVDLFVITKEDIPENLEFEIIFDNVPEPDKGYVMNDILLKSVNEYNKFKNATGMVQKAVELEGVDLSGLLSNGFR
ncbi:MAG: nucleotidyltransferase domain-containing protein [Oscillospiraceae bacterium]|nr:nucleotidyltransferase domain-containing protein [Oscillospiraceae bacterium]